MTLDEAIEILGRTCPPHVAYGNPRNFEKFRVITEATRLGIEALKKIKAEAAKEKCGRSSSVCQDCKDYCADKVQAKIIGHQVYD